MPNGGSSNCRSCKFNKVNEEGSSIPNYPEAAIPAYCVIRERYVWNPLWTYCVNYHSDSEDPEGPIYTGLSDDSRIPWYGNHEPKFGTYGQCHICGKKFERCIYILINDTDVEQFCCAQHYVKWWKTKNPHMALTWDIEGA